MVLLTELSPSSSSTHDHNHRYDVFLSFRGADTRNRFTAHLYKALVQADYNTFLDDEEIETGEPLKPELESAIKSSRASVIVLSKNYASSTWCLDELVLILEQQKSVNQMVIPIFYDVEPTDVRKQQKSFGEAMAKHKKRMEGERDVDKRNEWARKMELWRMALTQVAGLKGKDAKDKSETVLIEEIVDDLYRRLRLPLGTTTLPQLIGMDHHIKRISSWLKDGSKHTVDVLTIWGMGGIGKTSLAKYVYELHRHAYTSHSFVEDISRRCIGNHGLLKLQKQLYGDISKRKLSRVHNVSEYTSIICKALAHEEVLVIVDDINSYDQLDRLLGDKGFHPGSKIIITTKDASLIERCALFKTKINPKHTECKLEGLCVSDSLKLLCHHAFICNYPTEGYENVVKKLAKYCEGHPLALEVLGKSLHKRDVAYWEDRIKGLKKKPLSGIEKAKEALQMGFDSLLCDNDKELFKHIACFFVGQDRDSTETILKACDINTTSGITNLMEKCFLSIRWNKKLSMHSLIQEMGRDLVRQESPNKPWEWSRLWCHEESYDVLKRKKGTENILGLALDMSILDKKKLRGSVELKKELFSQMDNLLLLQLNYVELDECFQFPEELRWLCMHGFPLKAIHLHLPMENLVALDMSYSNIESFDISYSSPQPPTKRQKQLVGSCSKDKRLLGSLKILDLSYCEQLHSVGGFFELPALEKLIVSYCINLIKLCESVEQSVELVYIDLSYCKKLKKLPISLGKLMVKTLVLDGCNYLWESTIINSSDISINPQTSSSAIIVEAIPSDFKFFMTLLSSSLRILSLADANLSNESFPIDLSCLAMLEELCLNENPIVSLPNCVRTLPRIKKLSINNCDDLISVEHLPHTLRVFNMYMEACDRKIRKVKFDPEMHPLKIEEIPWWPENLDSPMEFEGILKIQPMVEVDEKLLHRLGWKKSDFTEEGDLDLEHIGMAYEFGIFSTCYWVKRMPKWIRCRKEGPSISFFIPSSPTNLRGLNFCCVTPYEDVGECLPIKLFIIMRNITKTQTWIYCLYTESKFGLLSHWMFGPNEMEAGDHIIIECDGDGGNGDYVVECRFEVGVGVVYDDGSMEEEEDVLSYYKSWNHIIGGDLSAFQATTGEYYLSYNQSWENYFRRIDDRLDCPFIDKGASYKVKELMFKAFSQKRFETDGSEAQCSQMRPTAMAPAGAPCMPMLPHGLGQQTFDGQAQPIFIPPQGQLVGESRVGVPRQQNQQLVPLMQQQAQCSQMGPTPLALTGCQQIFYGQSQSTFVSPQPGFGYPHQLAPDMSLGGGPMANFYLPMIPPGQHEPRPGRSYVGVPEQQNHQVLVPLMQQQMGPYGPISHLPHVSNIGDVSMGSVPYDFENVTHLPDAGGIFALTNASPTEQMTAQCSQMGPIPIATAGASCLPMFPPSLGQQFAYGQAQPTFIPPQPGFGHQHEPSPGMGLDGCPFPNFHTPMVQPDQHELLPGGSCVGAPGPLNQQQQMVPYGLMYPQPRGSNIGNVSMGSVPYNVENVMQLHDDGGIFELVKDYLG